MIAADAPFPDLPPARRGLTPRRVLAWFLAVAGGLVLLVLALVFWALPWFARRGDLNAIVESVIRSSLHPDLDVRIESLETDPLTRLAITSMEGVRTVGAEERFSFRCERISVLYNPIDLWFGRVEELRFVRPTLFLDLDADPASLFETPRLPPEAAEARRRSIARRERAGKESRGEAEPATFSLGHLGLEEGTLRLRYGGRDILVEDLDVELLGLGSSDLLSLDVTARVMGASLRVTGTAIPRGERRLELRDVRIQLDDVRLAPLLKILSPFLPREIAGLDGGGTIDLEGTIGGLWPAETKISLRAAAKDLSAVPREEAAKVPGVHGGAVDLSFAATVEGELESAAFDLSLEARGELAGETVRSREKVRIRLAGDFARRGGGSVHLGESCRLESAGLGTITLGGTASSLLSEPRLDLDVALAGLDLAALDDHIVAQWLGPATRWLSGTVAAQAHVAGAAGDPTIAASFSIGEARIAGTGIAFAARGRIRSISGLDDPGSATIEGLHVEVGGIDLAQVGTAAGLDASRDTLEGKLDAAVDIPRMAAGELPRAAAVVAHARETSVALGEDAFVLDSGSLDLRVDLSLAHGEGRGAEAPERLGARVHARLEAEGIGVGPVYEELTPTAVSLEGGGDVELSGPGYRLAGGTFRGRVELPSLGPVDIGGAITLPRQAVDGAAPPRIDVELHAPSIPCERFLGVYVRDAFETRYEILEGAAFTGEAEALVRVRHGPGGLAVSGYAASKGLGATLPAADLELAGLRFHVPFAWGAGSRDERKRGELVLERLALGGIALENVRLPLALDGGRYRLVHPASGSRFLGGALRVDRLEIGIAGDDAGVDAAVDLAGADLERFTTAIDLPAIEGRVDASVPRLHMDSSDVVIAGRFRVTAFGGEIEFSDLRIRNWSAPYATYSIRSAAIRDLDLLELGETFGIGVISGVLRGSARKVEWTPGEMTRFDIDVETVKHGVPQYITTGAIAALRRVLSGPLATVRRAFFSRFYYDRFGFEARLRENRFNLRGKYTIGGVEYIMYSRWWDFPWARIVIGRPGRTYGWRAILKRLGAGRAGGAKKK